MSELKLCVNCKHHCRAVGTYWCERKTVEVGKNPVTGAAEMSDPMLRCHCEREAGVGAWLGLRCGPTGKFFEETEL